MRDNRSQHQQVQAQRGLQNQLWSPSSTSGPTSKATLWPPNPLKLEQKEKPNAASLSSPRSYFLGPEAGMGP